MRPCCHYSNPFPKTATEFLGIHNRAMINHFFQIQRPQQAVAIVLFLLIGHSPCHAAEPNLAKLEQQALRAATDLVADSVVQIRTVGGLDRVGRTLLSQGPTTGLIVTEDGYIVSSAFNFVGQPTSILVRLANGRQLAAELIARDKNRMLVLLKVAATSALPVPEPVAHEEMRVGQWAVALGRTFQTEQVGVSVGIISALKRMYGRVIQTDASVSVANYGGPLVDISGRVFGVLVPMSPQASGGPAESELAGAEFYDSGIGFAVPLEHILSMLQRWKQGEDLLSGKLGIGLSSGDPHITPPTIVSVWPNSPAADAGWQPNDLITAVNGQSVSTQAHLRFQTTPSYAADTMSVTIRRGETELQTNVTLTGKLAPYRHAFLGILPDRKPIQDEQSGAVVRNVWPDSPADKAGLEVGDRITTINETEIRTTADALRVIAGLHPKHTATVVAIRSEEELTVEATLSNVPEEILSSVDLSNNLPNDMTAAATENDPRQSGQALELKNLKLPDFSQEAVYFLPTVGNGQRLGLLMWLGDGNPQHNQALIDAWQSTCRRDGLIFLIAPPKDEAAWKSDDLTYLEQLARTATRRFKLDRRRMAIGGQGKAGQLAFALAMKSRSAFSGVIGIDAPLPRTMKLRNTTPSNRLTVLSVESRNSNFAPLIRRDLKQLREAGYPTCWLQRPPTSDVSKEIDAATRHTMARWIATLDRY